MGLRSAYISTPGNSMAKTVGVKNYMGIVGFPTWTTTAANNAVVIPKNAGKVTLYHLEVDHTASTGSPGEGKGWEFRVFKNGVAINETLMTISGGTKKAEWNGTLLLEEGDIISWEVIAIGGESEVFLGTSLNLTMFMEAAGKVSFIFGMSTTALGTVNGNKYMLPCGCSTTAWQSTEGSLRGIIPVDGKVLGWTVVQSGSSGAGKAIKHFLRKNQAEDKSEIKIEGGVAASGTSGESFEVKSGDRLELKAILEGTPSSRNVKWGIAFEPALSVAVYMGCQIEAPDPSNLIVNVQFPSGPRLNTWGTGSANRVSWPTTSTNVSRLFAEVHVPPGEAKEWEPQFGVNGIPKLKFKIAGAGSVAASNVTETVVTGAADRIQFGIKGWNLPETDTGGVHWGFVVGKAQVEKTVVDGEATLTGEGKSTVGGTVRKNSTASISGTGSNSVQGSVRANGEAALTGTGSNAFAGTRRVNGSADLIGEGSMNEEGDVVSDGSANLPGTGTLTCQASVRRSGQASLSGSGVINATPSRRVNTGSSASGAGSIEVRGSIRSDQAVALLGEGSLEATGHIDGQRVATYEGVPGSTYEDDSSEYSEAAGFSVRTAEYGDE